MSTIITVASSKGGSGKTTSATTLAAGLANFDRTLLIDFDAQGHCSLAFGLPVRGGLFEWMVDELPLENCLLPGRPASLAILPGDSRSKAVERLYTSDLQFVGLVGRLHALDYPYVVIDTNPSGLLTEVALAAADIVIVPVRPEAFGLDGLFASLELMQELAPVARMAILPVGFDGRLREHHENLAVLQKGNLRPLPAIRQRVAVMEAQSRGQTIWEYTGQGIRDVQSDYNQLVGCVMEMVRGAVTNG